MGRSNQAHAPASSSIAAAGGGAGAGHPPQRVRDQAEEFERPAARIAELVDAMRGDEDDGAGAQRAFAIAVQHDAGPFEHEDFMLVAVGMLGSVAARGDFELSHAEAGRAVRFSDQAADLASGSTILLDRRGFDLFVVDNFHENTFR